MKTSFYFVLWILIYPILGLFRNEVIYEHSFFIALVVVYGISWMLNRSMPKTLLYEKVSYVASILENVYTGNVRSFAKRLSKDAIVETVTAVYFCITTVVLEIAVLKTGVNDWFALLVFFFFMAGAIIRSSRLVNAYFRLKSNPTPEQCMEIAENTYKMDYASYYEVRFETDYDEMFPPRPRYYKAFQLISIIIAIFAILLGLFYILSGIWIMIEGSSFEVGAVAGMYFLYGTLATYFGVKDVINIANSMKGKYIAMGA